ncbi:hypothetical protein GALMADRAFT_1276626 [Galerina marginata CBS 339.88]|uniref:Uncharacterized protein n=1 Tax=Galerina marginata (strain CBS 339.88) TaxID=685588 RepID=A0A067TG56_GALM3|nr:hypothetical protein GALMADRAFT_1276626 [Galerina marginata CBS 339.88]
MKLNCTTTHPSPCLFSTTTSRKFLVMSYCSPAVTMCTRLLSELTTRIRMPTDDPFGRDLQNLPWSISTCTPSYNQTTIFSTTILDALEISSTFEISHSLPPSADPLRSRQWPWVAVIFNDPGSREDG